MKGILGTKVAINQKDNKKGKSKSNIIPWMNWIALWIYSEL